MDARRIGHLLTPEALLGKHLVVIGLGSGGFPAIQALAMCGVKRWTLFDKDELDLVNLVKHPGKRSEVGQRKTTVAENWIMDRNPDAEVTSHDIDITTEEGEVILASSIESADVVMVCTDNQNTRLIVNDICVEMRTTCVWGIIWRTGFGGNVMLYDPQRGGCFRCMHAEGSQVEVERMMQDAKQVSEIESKLQEKQYGRDADPKFGLSGLSIDIQLISLLMARVTLSALLDAVVSEEFLESISDPVATTQAETHMLAMPYDVRGPVEPESSGDSTLWWDTKNGQALFTFPMCSNCERDVNERDNYCARCGYTLIWSEEGSVEIDEKSSKVVRTWIPLERPQPGHLMNYLSLANRRMVIDELSINAEGEKVRTGNTKISVEPFTMNKMFIEPSAGCSCEVMK